MISALQHKSIFNFEPFGKKLKILDFHIVVLVKTFNCCINYQCRTDIDEAKLIPVTLRR